MRTRKLFFFEKWIKRFIQREKSLKNTKTTRGDDDENNLGKKTFFARVKKQKNEANNHCIPLTTIRRYAEESTETNNNYIREEVPKTRKKLDISNTRRARSYNPQDECTK